MDNRHVAHAVPCHQVHHVRNSFGWRYGDHAMSHDFAHRHRCGSLAVARNRENDFTFRNETKNFVTARYHQSANIFCTQPIRRSVDLPGLEGDFGVLAGHTPIVAALRPGIVDIRTADTRQRFVVLGGLAEFSKEELTVLADTASPVEEFDLADLMARIEQMQDNLAKISIGEELDHAIEQLDHYKTVHKSLTLTRAL
jgi:F-type H+-transporting ATPase subunit epsilon